jgi:hypothetical protein
VTPDADRISHELRIPKELYSMITHAANLQAAPKESSQDSVEPS